MKGCIYRQTKRISQLVGLGIKEGFLEKRKVVKEGDIFVDIYNYFYTFVSLSVFHLRINHKVICFFCVRFEYVECKERKW